MKVQIKPFSLENDYCIIDNGKIAWTCLIPIEQTNKFKIIFENCKTPEEVEKIIKEVKNYEIYKM